MGKRYGYPAFTATRCCTQVTVMRPSGDCSRAEIVGGSERRPRGPLVHAIAGNVGSLPGRVVSLTPALGLVAATWQRGGLGHGTICQIAPTWRSTTRRAQQASRNPNFIGRLHNSKRASAT